MTTFAMTMAWLAVIFGFASFIMAVAKPERADHAVEILASCCAVCLVPAVIALGASL